MTMRPLLFSVLLTVGAFAQDAVYKNDFQSAEVGKVPEGMMVIDGAFAVAEEGGNKFLELPGAPLDTFTLLFGSTEKENRFVTARIFGTSKGRRYPTFNIGLNGIGGCKLQVSPSKKALEILKGDAIKATAPFEWKSGGWTWLSMTLKKVKEGEWLIEGRAWADGSVGPVKPVITFTDTEPPIAGLASIGGSPYATTPIRYDDLQTGPAK